MLSRENPPIMRAILISKKVIIVGVLAALVLILSCVYSMYPPPRMGIRLTSEVEGHSCTLYWRVTNHANRKIHFEDYKVAIGSLISITLPEDYRFNTSDAVITLKPKEFYETQFVVNDLPVGYYNAQVTASCREGTTGTMIINFKIR